MTTHKYKPSIDLGHIGELHALDRTLQERGEQAGIRPHIVELIARLTSGGVAPVFEDPRFAAGKKNWDRGFGRKQFGSQVDYKTFEEYLASIPQIPSSLVPHDPEFPLLTLVDPRLGLRQSCKRIGIKYEELDYRDADAVPFDDRHVTPQDPFWVRLHDGRRNRDRLPNDCRRECMGSVYAMTAMVAVHAYLHHPGIIEQCVHVLDCPGSVHAKRRSYCASLGAWDGEVRLSVGRYTSRGYPRYGSGGFRRK